MLKQTIEDLWNGNLGPGTKCGVDIPEMEQLSILLDRNREALQETLTLKQMEILQKYTECQNDICSLFAKQAFCDGFCLASKLMSEALTEST